MPADEDEDIEVLEGRQSLVPVPESLAQGGAPVAAAVVEHVGAVLRVEPGGADDDGWPQASINVYARIGEQWAENGGGGFDWDWPIDFVPAQDTASGSFFGTPLDDRRGVWLVPHYGPDGPWLEAILDDDYRRNWLGGPPSGREG